MGNKSYILDIHFWYFKKYQNLQLFDQLQEIELFFPFRNWILCYKCTLKILKNKSNIQRDGFKIWTDNTTLIKNRNSLSELKLMYWFITNKLDFMNFLMQMLWSHNSEIHSTGIITSIRKFKSTQNLVINLETLQWETRNIAFKLY